MTVASDYDIPPHMARALRVVALMPADLRREAVRDLPLDREALADLFAEFIGLANSVADNCREMVELLLITEGGMHPHTAEKANLPTIGGALAGVGLAAGLDTSTMCSGCAFRPGTPANQSPVTTLDADCLSHPGEEPFWCHHDMNDRGEPTKACAGFAQLRAKRKVKE
jgi:hypothetical protein